jgi:hypothetical protein
VDEHLKHQLNEAAMSVHTTERMPSLYLSNGAPPLVDDRRWVAELSAVATGLPPPNGLPFLRDFRPDANAPGWSREFDAWTTETLRRGAVDELADFRNRAPGMPYAHPTVEHFAPMFVTLGAGDPEQAPKQLIDGFWRACPNVPSGSTEQPSHRDHVPHRAVSGFLSAGSSTMVDGSPVP